MRRLLEEFEDLLRQQSRTVAVERLAPGVSADTVVRTLRTAGIETPPPKSLIDFYAWHNGQYEAGATIGELWVVPGLMPVSLSRGEATHQAGMQTVEQLKREQPTEDCEWVWHREWWPLLFDGGGVKVVVDLESATSEDAPVLEHWNDAGVVNTYSGIRPMVEVFIERIRRGAYFVDDQGDFDYDIDLEREVAREIDPAGDYPRLE